MKKSCSSATLAVALLLVGCSASESPEKEPELVELVASDQALALATDASESALVAQAKKFYGAKLYHEALQTFDVLKESYPFGAYLEFAELKIADCNFELRDYQTAAQAYEEFIKAHPSSNSLPYAIMQAGRSYKAVVTKVGRDPKALRASVEKFDQFLNDHSDSIYSLAVQKYRAEAINDLIDYERMVKNFYTAQGKPKAAQARAKKIAYWEEHANKIGVAKPTAIPEATNNEMIPNPELLSANRSEASSRPNFRPPHVVLAQRNLADLRKDNNFATAPATEIESSASEPAIDLLETNRIVRVDCRQSKRQIYIYLSKPMVTNDEIYQGAVLAPKGGSVNFTVPSSIAKAFTTDCLATKDLDVTASAEFNLRTTQPAEVFVLQNPNRLLIALTS